MLREINLIEYIPEFMRDFKEIAGILASENVEITKIYKDIVRALDNQFIISCDEVGVERFEKIVGITPEVDDNLAARIARLISRWNFELPYTLNGVRDKLISLCGKDNYMIIPKYEIYTLKITVSLPVKSQLAELESYLIEVLPANMDYEINNILKSDVKGKGYYNGNWVSTLIKKSIESEGIV